MSGPQRAETLFEFFRLNEKNEQVTGKIGQLLGQQLSDVARAAFQAAGAGALSPDLVAGFFAKGLDLVLTTPLKDVLASGWKAWTELVVYHDRTKYPAGETFLCKPHKGTVTNYAYKPGLQLLANGQTVPGATLQFEVGVQLLNTPVLEIRDGRIMSATLSHFEGKGTIKCLDTTLLERALGELTLEGKLDFGEGLVIPSGFSTSGQPKS